MFYVAKAIQALGMADVAWAVFIGMTREQAMAAELRLALVGVAVFGAGRLLERLAAR